MDRNLHPFASLQPTGAVNAEGDRAFDEEEFEACGPAAEAQTDRDRARPPPPRAGLAATGRFAMSRSIAAAAAVLALAGCASLNVLDTQVSSFSRWPAGRAPATYAFERLPSQQANPQAAEVLEDSARRAVEAAGFVPAGEGAVPDVSVQIGARITATDRSPFDDPFWYGPYGWGPYTGRSSTAATAAATGARTRARTGDPTDATAPGVRATTTTSRTTSARSRC